MKGKLFDERSLPLSHAYVALTKLKIWDSTDINGTFEIRNGSYTSTLQTPSHVTDNAHFSIMNQALVIDSDIKASKFKCRITNMLGATVFSLDRKDILPGRNTFMLKGMSNSQLALGLYVLHLSLDGKVYSTKYLNSNTTGAFLNVADPSNSSKRLLAKQQASIIDTLLIYKSNIIYEKIPIETYFDTSMSIVSNQSPNGRGSAPSVTPFAHMKVFVGEPLDFYIPASDPEGDRITFSLTTAPASASIDPSTGLFSWRPAIGDTGAIVIGIRASDGFHASADSMEFTVVKPSLGTEPGLRILRPAYGDTTSYAYGDTLTIAFAMTWCGDQPLLTFVPKEGRRWECIFVQNNTGGNAIARDQLPSDSLDNSGRVCKFSRTWQSEGYWVGFYRLSLVNAKTIGSECLLDFGGGTMRKDSIRIKVEDVYGFDRCGMSNPGAVSQVTSGAYSGYFSVVPRL